MCILPPASARQPVGWRMGGERALCLKEGVIASATPATELANPLITQHKLGGYKTTVPEDEEQERLCH